MAVVAALFQGRFNFGRHAPIDGERPVEVEGHDATIHKASAGLSVEIWVLTEIHTTGAFSTYASYRRRS